MKTMIFFAFFFFSSHTLALKVAVGSSITLPAPGDSEVHIGSKKLITALDQGDSIVLIGKKVGTTFVTLNGHTQSITVTSSSNIQMMEELKQLFKKRKGLHVEWAEEKIQVTGEIYIFKDWLEISEISRRLDADYDFKALPTKDVLAEASKYFQSQMTLMQIQAFQIAPALPLKAYLNPKNNESFKRAQSFLSHFGITAEKNKELLEVRPLIKTSVILAEVSRQVSESFGFELPTQAEAQLLPQWKGPSALMGSLKALETKGLGKVLASPTLNCRSGAEAEFHAGGEFPIRLSGYRKQSVEWKKHGVVLKVRPRADLSGTLQIEVESEISLLDASQVVDGLPALKTNRVSSQFDLSETRTIALSGLIQETWGRSRSGLFGFSQIPILGALFRSEDFLNHKSELVVFVTPEIVQSETNEAIHWPKGWFQDEL